MFGACAPFVNISILRGRKFHLCVVICMCSSSSGIRSISPPSFASLHIYRCIYSPPTIRLDPRSLLLTSSDPFPPTSNLSARPHPLMYFLATFIFCWAQHPARPSRGVEGAGCEAVGGGSGGPTRTCASMEETSTPSSRSSDTSHSESSSVPYRANWISSSSPISSSSSIPSPFPASRGLHWSHAIVPLRISLRRRQQSTQHFWRQIPQRAAALRHSHLHRRQ